MNHQELWAAVVDYYYDNIHWASDQTNSPTIREWLQRDFQVDYSMHLQKFMFPNEEAKAWFLLRWQ